MVLLISYDLNGYERPKAYEDVANMIEKHATSTKRPLYSQWFVETTSSVDTWHQRMKEVTDNNDNWFIVKVTTPYAGWLNKSIWPWLKERV